MPYVQLAGSPINQAGQAAAAFQDQVSPAVNAISGVQMGVANLQLRRQALEQQASQDLAREMLQREELRLYDERTQVGRIGAQSRAAAAEVEERTKLAEGRAKTAEQARQLGYPNTPEGTAGLLYALQEEDPQGFQQIVESFPEGIEAQQLPALWRAAAETLTAGREMRAQSQKIGSARRVVESVEAGSQFWNEETALGLMALASDPNTSAEEYAAAEAEAEAEAKAEYQRKAKNKAYTEQATALVKGAKNLTGENADKAFALLGQFESGKVDDPEASLLRLQTITTGLEPALARVEETAFTRGMEVGAARARTMTQFVPEGVATGDGPGAALDSDALSGMRPQTRPAGPRVKAGSKLGESFMDETQREAARIRAAMRAQGLDPTDPEAIGEFLDAEAARTKFQRDPSFLRAGGPF